MGTKISILIKTKDEHIETMEHHFNRCSKYDGLNSLNLLRDFPPICNANVAARSFCLSTCAIFWLFSAICSLKLRCIDTSLSATFCGIKIENK